MQRSFSDGEIYEKKNAKKTQKYQQQQDLEKNRLKQILKIIGQNKFILDSQKKEKEMNPYQNGDNFVK